MKTEYGYDAVGNLVRQANGDVTLTYRYDLNHRMTEEARTEGGTTLRSGFAYDKAGQLTSFRRSDGYAEAYTYDPVGNMVEKTLNGTKIAMTYDAANELKTMESSHGKLTYAYDLNGNLTQKTLGDRTDTYAYDARNHLKQYRGYDNYAVKYSYNALGMLHARESSGNHSRTTLEELIAGKEDSDDPDGDGAAHLTTFIYDLTQPYYEVLTETTDGEVTSYTYGLERLAAYTDDTRTAYLYDGRGSVIQTVQTNIEKASFADAVRTSMAYSTYGEILTEKVSGFGYNGEYYDAATGMLNLRARQYEPAQARFSQRDSLKGSAASPRSLNAYLYCQNDAINYFDASGAAMMAVNMTDRGGGKKSNSSSATLFQKAGQTIKNVVSTVASAAAVAKAANDQALANAQESSMFGVSSDPATVRHMARMNRAQAQASTPAVRGTKQGACMSQEEHDSFWKKLYNYLFPSSCAPKDTPEPTLSPVPNPTLITISTPLKTPDPTPGLTPKPTPTIAPNKYDKDTVLRIAKESGASETALGIIGRAADYLGMEYSRYDTNEKKYIRDRSKTKTVDCSQLAEEAYADAISGARKNTTRYQLDYVLDPDHGWKKRGTDPSKAYPGDAIFFVKNAEQQTSVFHVAIYIGQNLMIESTHTDEYNGVIVRPADTAIYYSIRDKAGNVIGEEAGVIYAIMIPPNN